MKASELNDWLGVITNVGVITGLILIAYEIHQNNIALEREARISYVETVDGIRGAWQNWEYTIIENREVADIWMRGNAGEQLDRLEEFRFELLAKENYRLIEQNYRQYTMIDGEPADWAVRQLAGTVRRNPRLKPIFLQQLTVTSRRRNVDNNPDFRSRVKELDLPEFRTETPPN